MTTKRNRRIVIWAVSLSLLLGLAVTPGFIPSAQAASASASARLIKKLKKQITAMQKQIATLQQQVSSLNQQLASALQPAPFLEMVTVGDPGNPPGEASIYGQFGAVATTFRIGKFEVTNVQYAAFLNAVAGEDTYGLFNTQMGFDATPLGGIRQFGTSPNFQYATRSAMADKPVNFVSWFDAARFCNWLHNGRPTGAQNASTTETGAYTLNGASSGVGFTKEAAAKFWLPSADEWHKAAYHQPASQGGDPNDSYWLYPTGSNAIPTEATSNELGEISNDNGNLANYNFGADWNAQNGNLTTVGSGGAGSASHYGAFDMGGNVKEWTDFAEATFRFVLGGGYFNPESQMRASERDRYNPVTEFDEIGFRVAGSLN